MSALLWRRLEGRGSRGSEVFDDCNELDPHRLRGSKICSPAGAVRPEKMLVQCPNKGVPSPILIPAVGPFHLALPCSTTSHPVLPGEFPQNRALSYCQATQGNLLCPHLMVKSNRNTLFSQDLHSISNISVLQLHSLEFSLWA